MNFKNPQERKENWLKKAIKPHLPGARKII
jgi:hypothetical protein